MFGKKTVFIALGAIVAVLVGCGGGSGPDSSVLNQSPSAGQVAEAEALAFFKANHHEFSASGTTSSDVTTSDTSTPSQTRNLTLLASHDLGGDGWNTDVWAHGDYAYVGTWGYFGAICPAGGTKVIDISDPSAPSLAAVIPAPAKTQTNDVKVAKMATKYFKGDILVVSNEDCDYGGGRGFEIWDVSDPEDASLLGRYGPAATAATVGPAFFDELIEWGQGVHNTFIFEQKGRVYVAAVIDFSEIYAVIFGVPPSDALGDLRIVEITDPANPVLVSGWGLYKDLNQDPFAGQGTDSVFSSPHDVWVEKGVAYVSEWDGGLVLLDVSDPANPTLISQTKYASTAEGNTHVAVPARGGNLVLVGDEDFTLGPWGFLRIFDTSDEANPVELAQFGTANTIEDPAPDDGDYTIHNIIVRGNSAYISWYGDGVRVIDFSNPKAPQEIASFVPPATADPYGFFPTRSNVWGIYVHGDLILASDTNSGLHILKHTK